MQLERSREFSLQFLDWVRGKGRVLIVAHDNPDPDSLAAAAALKHLLLKTTGQEATIAYGGMIGRGENRAMAQELEIDAVHFSGIDPGQFQVVCMVDTQPGTGNNSFPDNLPVHLVIDHHPLRDACQTCRWVDVREDYGASATILLEYLLAHDVSFGTRLATILFYAIKSETQDLGRDWVRADREAYLYLLPLANNRILYRVTHPKVPRDYFFSYSRAIENSRIYGDVLAFNLYRVDNPDIVAEMADFLLRMEGVSLVLGMGHDGEDVYLSLRTGQPDINAGELIRTVMADLGTAGGHHNTAGGQIRSHSASQTTLRRLERRLTRRLLDALERKPVRGRRLLPQDD
ncbi:nanoRNase/pAp phosphatase (c-di-AMP/oligoRNAs hydrolase) [Geothermobacter ehrlichii]|uniref:NanoRNase/pAp phosphatase (C-di-AMP/oligoRNAs hydrolase) n=1 Tax=Geothermobacter ehrlichii TaxID=213224 RepID=A0A5D3WKB4_9BACT|nr:DHHA1 domain-containing protein [Geothermobacter ehrlichii]TYO98794.1 nanoRNase/pAp phosphatase (c-di-AMP/oligoRNAs hydrolase) [Geothermobacter ehrlichii]